MDLAESRCWSRLVELIDLLLGGLALRESGGGTAATSVASVLVAVSACVTADCSEAFEMPPVKLVAMLLTWFSQVPIAVQTLLAYASFALVLELSPPPQPAAMSATETSSVSIATAATRMPGP